MIYIFTSHIDQTSHQQVGGTTQLKCNTASIKTYVHQINTINIGPNLYRCCGDWKIKL